MAEKVTMDGIEFIGGTKRFKDDDVWYNWALCSAKHSTEDILSVLQWYDSYRGAGQYFSHAPIVRRTKTRVLITQRCGYDV